MGAEVISKFIQDNMILIFSLIALGIVIKFAWDNKDMVNAQFERFK